MLIMVYERNENNHVWKFSLKFLKQFMDSQSRQYIILAMNKSINQVSCRSHINILYCGSWYALMVRMFNGYGGVHPIFINVKIQ